MKACKFLIQNLGSFHLENTKQGKLLCSTLPIPIPKPFTHTYKFKPIAIFYIVSLFKRQCLRRKFGLLISLGHSHTRSSSQSPLIVVAKRLFIPQKKKEKYERHSCPLSKKKRKGKMYDA